jgi:LruC domain-containing protein
MPSYTFLSEYDTFGYPKKIDKHQELEHAFLDEIKRNLPEKKSVRKPEWLRKADFKTDQACEINLTFVKEGAHYKNTLSYYVYDLNCPPRSFADIAEYFVVLPNASALGSGGCMRSGDTIRLIYRAREVVGDQKIASGVEYTFPAGVGIGFVLHADAWRNNGSPGAYFDAFAQQYGTDPAFNTTAPHSLAHYAVNYRSSAASGRFVVGFEDVRRDHSGCDHDFNDVVFYLTPTKSFRCDCYNTDTRRSYVGTLLCEDLHNKPHVDFDFNDFIAEYTVHESFLPNGNLRAVLIKLKGIARGAAYLHEFGVLLPGVHRVDGVKAYSQEDVTATRVSKVRELQIKPDDHVVIVENTKRFLPPPPTGAAFAANTVPTEPRVPPSYVAVRIDFGDKGWAHGGGFPYNFYLRVYRPNNPNMWTLYSKEWYTDVCTRLQKIGVRRHKKIIVLEDYLGFHYPKERKPLSQAYPRYPYSLLAGRGGSDKLWYTHPAPELTMSPPVHIPDPFVPRPAAFLGTWVDEGNYRIVPSTLGWKLAEYRYGIPLPETGEAVWVRCQGHSQNAYGEYYAVSSTRTHVYTQPNQPTSALTSTR